MTTAMEEGSAEY